MGNHLYQEKLHKKREGTLLSVCGSRISNLAGLTDDKEKVTCGSCRRLIRKKKWSGA